MFAYYICKEYYLSPIYSLNYQVLTAKISTQRKNATQVFNESYSNRVVCTTSV
jgi:hypothetical protein